MILDTNIKNRASSQYLNFDFNSACSFNGSVMVAGSSGLFKLAGDLDDTAKIPAYFEPVETDMGISNPKRLRAIYVSYEAVSALVITVSTELGNSQSFTLPATAGENKIEKLIPNRDLHGRYFTFNIGNGTTGGAFAVEYIQAVPNVLAHRRSI